MGKTKREDKKEQLEQTPIIGGWDYKPLPRFKANCSNC
jgi:hypothetical protein